ncbi:MAG TPA: hypothetical protein VJB12_02320 [Candidatus Nanoarchaeia archaeon]|nr:hypothetical protein [Candidatus Nanoarchaeia archaeon]
MKTKEEIEEELKLLDSIREDIEKKFEAFNTNPVSVDREELADTLLNGLTTIVKYYTLCWVIEKSDDEKLQFFQRKIKKEYIEPLSSMIKGMLKE